MYLMNINEMPPEARMVTDPDALVHYIEDGQGRVGGLLFSTDSYIDWAKDEGISGTYAHELDLPGGGGAILTFTPRDESPKITLGSREFTWGAIRVWRTIVSDLED